MSVFEDNFAEALLHRDWAALLYSIPNASDLNCRCENGNTALILAASYSHHRVVDALIKAGANVHTTNADGNNALIFAAWNRDLESIKLLLKAGININAKGDHGNTAIMGAIESGYLDVVQLLMENNADIHIKNDNNQNATELAKSVKEQEIAAYLEQFELDRLANVKNDNNLNIL